MEIDGGDVVKGSPKEIRGDQLLYKGSNKHGVLAEIMTTGLDDNITK